MTNHLLLAIFKWDPTKHPRNLLGQFREVLDALEHAAHDYGVDITVHPVASDGAIKVASIRTDTSARREGRANEVMDAVIDIADKVGVPIVLTPEADRPAFEGPEPGRPQVDPGMTTQELHDWYMRKGFVDNKGAQKDFRFMDSMIRKPKERPALPSPKNEGLPKVGHGKNIADILRDRDKFLESINQPPDRQKFLFSRRDWPFDRNNPDGVAGVKYPPFDDATTYQIKIMDYFSQKELGSIWVMETADYGWAGGDKDVTILEVDSGGDPYIREALFTEVNKKYEDSNAEYMLSAIASGEMYSENMTDDDRKAIDEFWNKVEARRFRYGVKIGDHELKSWEPGKFGKGILVENPDGSHGYRLLTWVIDSDFDSVDLGSPHHTQVWERFPGEAPMYMPILIAPNGTWTWAQYNDFGFGGATRRPPDFGDIQGEIENAEPLLTPYQFNPENKYIADVNEWVRLNRYFGEIVNTRRKATRIDSSPGDQTAFGTLYYEDLERPRYAHTTGHHFEIKKGEDIIGVLEYDVRGSDESSKVWITKFEINPRQENQREAIAQTLIGATGLDLGEYNAYDLRSRMDVTIKSEVAATRQSLISGTADIVLNMRMDTTAYNYFKDHPELFNIEDEFYFESTGPPNPLGDTSEYFREFAHNLNMGESGNPSTQAGEENYVADLTRVSMRWVRRSDGRLGHITHDDDASWKFHWVTVEPNLAGTPIVESNTEEIDGNELVYVPYNRDPRDPNDALFKHMTDRIQEFVDDGEVTVRIWPRSFLSFLRQGRLRNLHETGDTSGTNDRHLRRVFERAAFGPQAPIYGHIEPNNVNDIRQSVANSYGDIRLVLKDHIRDRTTVTFGDSLSGPSNGIWPSPAREISPLTAFRARYPWYRTEDSGSDGWFLENLEGDMINDTDLIETQIFGGVTPDDIAEVVFEKGPPTDEVARQLASAGIPWRVSHWWPMKVRDGYSRVGSTHGGPSEETYRPITDVDYVTWWRSQNDEWYQRFIEKFERRQREYGTSATESAKLASAELLDELIDDLELDE